MNISFEKNGGLIKENLIGPTNFVTPKFLISPIISDFFVRPSTSKSDAIVTESIQELGTGLKKFPYLEKEDWSKDGVPKTVDELVKEKISAGKKEAKQGLIEEGFSATIAKVTDKLNKTSLDNDVRMILSNENIYVLALSRTIKYEGIKDVDGIFGRVMQYASNHIRKYLNRQFAKKVISSDKIDVGDVLEVILAEMEKVSFSFKVGAVRIAVKAVIDKFSNDGPYYKLVDKFFSKTNPEIDPAKATPGVRKAMVKYLKDIGLIAPDPAAISSRTVKYDEYLAMAFVHTVQAGEVDDDPVKSVFSSSGIDSFTYAVDYFETAEEQGIEVENILAAGTLYYIKTLADDLGILPVADAVLMRWTSGMLDIPQGETSTNLYRYYKLMNDRINDEERKMFYHMVLNVGDGKVLDQASVNSDFPNLWDTLMEEVVKYIQKFESKDDAFDVVSKSSIIQSIKDLQYNLTMYTSGIVKAMLPEMYKQLEHAISILDDENVKNQLGRGFRRSMWNVVERISAEEFNYMPNTSSLRTSAVNGHKIFTFIAHFEEGAVTEEAFQEFVQLVESFIIAQGLLSGRSVSGHLAPNNEIEEAEIDEEDMGDEWDF